MTPAGPQEALREASRHVVQGLFERMADEYRGTVTLERWYSDGGAKICFEEDGDYGTSVRVSFFPNSSGTPLVAVTPLSPKTGREWGPTVYVSPVPSAVIAVATR